MATRKSRSGPDLAARFAAQGEAVVTEAEQAVFACGVKVKDAARKLAPVKTGTLRDSYAVKLRRRRNNPAAVIGTPVPYGTYVEFARQIGGHAYGKHLREPARVLYRALDDNEEEIVRMIDAAIGRGLGKVEGP